MKIRTKLLGSFVIVAAIGVVIGALGFFSNQSLAGSSEDLLAYSELRANISSILFSHYIWRHGLSQTVYEGEVFTGSLDGNTCSLGRWLNSDEVNQKTDSEILGLLDLIVEPHNFIHTKAALITNHLNNDNQGEAIRLFREEILPKTAEVISLLEKIDERYGVLMNIEIYEILELSHLFVIFILVFIIVAVIVSVILALSITSNIVKPILPFSAFMEKVSATGDIVMRGEESKIMERYEKRGDEIGRMIRSFSDTIAKIKGMVLSIKGEAAKLSDIGADLASNMNQTAAAVNEITANVQSIKTRVVNQSASVTETNATMEQVTTNIDKLNSHVEDQSTHVTQASSSIEEMVANIHSVIATLIKNTENVNHLKEASEVGRTGLQDVAADIQEIARESEGLMEINAVIENIASQTNLLSMNAAIEAAHAGEAGRGFSVVADEIRKLAEGSTEQSKTIATVLRKIKESMDKITRSTENVLNKFEAIDSNVRLVAEQGENIRNAMEEQGHGSKQLLDGVINVKDITRQVRSGSNEMLEGAKEVIQESMNLERVTQEISSGMNEMALGADQINVAVHHVNEISVKNSEGIATLIREVSKFTVE
ncbi:MAG: methyl-accepting chemotaxis protein [Treponema sp.]|nr:methyl-accepting chemotaxis protein [Treponema sp.]